MTVLLQYSYNLYRLTTTRNVYIKYNSHNAISETFSGEQMHRYAQKNAHSTYHTYIYTLGRYKAQISSPAD